MPVQTSLETLTLDEALQMISAARKKAEDLKVPSNIAVVDAGGNLLAFERMNGAWLGSIQIAQDKAYTARAFDMSTKELAKLSGPDGPLFGIHTQPNIVIFAGGIPVKRGDQVVGAIGSSGGTVDQDQKIAEAGVHGLR
jgi:uncharacterized protein GlcG (DUF336 family)